MSGTLEGGKKAAKTNLKRQGSDYYARIGSKGGRISKRVPASIKELRERITEDSKLATVLQDYLPQKKEINKIIKDMYE